MDKQLYLFQDTGADFLAARRFAGLWDEMGLGKTAQAVIGAERARCRKALVIAPHIGLINWQREIEDWQPLASTAILTNREQPAADWELVNYDLLSRAGAAQQMLRQRRYDLIVLDECQALKEHGSKRTAAVYGAKGVAKCGSRLWTLSGSPAPNHPGELYPHLLACFPQTLATHAGTARMSYDGFLAHYCRTTFNVYGGEKVIGVQNMGDLRRRLAPYVLRRTLRQVLPDMPKLRFSRVSLQPADALERLAWRSDMIELETALRAAMAALKLDEPDRPEDDRLLEALAVMQSTPIATARRLFGEALAPLIAELVEAELAGGLDKIIIFYHHRNVGAALASMLHPCSPLRIEGSTPRRRRHEFIDRFQQDPSARVMLAQLDVAHRVITLTAAAHVLFAEASWVPTVNFQAARRALRIGQTRPVLARFAVLAGSLHETIMRAVVRKTAMLAELWDEAPETLEDHHAANSA